MKILVGMLVTIENEYNDCLESIKAQTFVDYDIYEIRNKPKYIAHNLLYQYFMNNKQRYDLMIHIAPDMVIVDNNLFRDIVNEFENKYELDRLFIPTFDHFAGENLGGVNVYRNTVQWDLNKDNYFTDRVHKDYSIRENRKWKISEERPLICHCPNPSNYQAFHLGLHRSIKAFQFGRRNKIYLKSHWMMFNNIKRNYLLKKDRRLLLALAAARYVISNKLDDTYINYENQNTYKIYEEINLMNDDQLYDYAINNIYMRMLTIFGKYSYYLIMLLKK